jgi:hypothetical protein
MTYELHFISVHNKESFGPEKKSRELAALCREEGQKTDWVSEI